MEDRIARLEADVEYLRSDVAEIKADLRALRERMARPRIASSPSSSLSNPNSLACSDGIVRRLSPAATPRAD
jgi:hypothetical protein